MGRVGGFKLMKLQFKTRIRSIEQKITEVNDTTFSTISETIGNNPTYGSELDYPWITIYLDGPEYIGKFKIGESIKVTIESI